MAGAGVLAGAFAGVIAGGIGSRLAMRILAVVNDDKAGLVTENGNIAGEITAGGTIGLVIFGGVFPGLMGGLIYVAVRRWLPGSGLWKGLAFGVLLFLLFGAVVINSDNVDFALFGPAALSVALFALLFPLYGLLVSPLVERLNRYIPPLFMNPVVTYAG